MNVMEFLSQLDPGQTGTAKTTTSPAGTPSSAASGASDMLQFLNLLAQRRKTAPVQGGTVQEQKQGGGISSLLSLIAMFL
jgi:hypothetical protein